MSFYAKYPVGVASPTTIDTVQGPGTAGTPTGGVLTIQGDPAGTPIPISGTITASNAAVGPTGSAVPASADYVGYSVSGTLTGATGTANGLKVDGSAVTQPVSGTVTANAGTGTFTVSGTVTANAGTGTFAVSAAALPLPTGASTSALQTTGNTSVASIDTKTPALGQAAMASSVPVVIASNQSAVPVSLASVPAVTASTAVFQAEAAVAFGSITNAYATLFTPSAATKILQLRNNTNASVAVSFDAGSTTNYILDSGDQVSLDLLANSLAMSTTAIQVRYAVGAPTSGSFRINGCH